MPVVGILRKCELPLLAGLISRIIDFNLKIILASAKLFTKPSVSLWTENDTDHRPFARWRHFTTTTRILQGFAFLCK